MTITLKVKNQITIPKKITKVLGIKQGDMFDIVVANDRIELVPLEVKERKFTRKEYAKLDALSRKERGSEKKVTKAFIENLKKGV